MRLRKDLRTLAEEFGKAVPHGHDKTDRLKGFRHLRTSLLDKKVTEKVAEHFWCFGN